MQWRSQFLAHVGRERLFRSEACNQKPRRGATSDDEEMLFASSPVFAVVDTCCCGCCCCCCCCSASNCSWSLLCWLIIVLTSSGCDNLPDEGGVLSAAAWRGVASCFSMCPRPALAEPGGWAGVVMLPLRLGETIFFFFFFQKRVGVTNYSCAILQLSLISELQCKSIRNNSVATSAVEISVFGSRRKRAVTSK